MQLFQFLLTLSLSLPLTTAIPFPFSPFHTVHKRGLPGAVYVCTDPHFLGECGWTNPDGGKCHIPGGTDSQKPESIGPDPGGFCILFEDSTCTGKEVTRISFPGLADNVPKFGGLQCFTNGQDQQNPDAPATQGADGKKNRTDLLAGGQGSRRNKQLGDVLESMERRKYREGLIGLEKNIYY